jgi:hypothetical protein
LDKEEFEELKELRTELIKSIDIFFENPKLKDWNGADVNEAFRLEATYNKEPTFIEDNWNDRRINLFRAFFHIIHNEWVKIGRFEIIHQWHEDTNYVTLRDTKNNDLYYVEWYKSRGCTSMFLKNGNPIMLGAYKELITELLTGEFVEPIY